jgi:hypothetical protein
MLGTPSEETWAGFSSLPEVRNWRFKFFRYVLSLHTTAFSSEQVLNIENVPMGGKWD